MKAFASGDLGSFKMLREIALDTGLYRSVGGSSINVRTHQGDLLTRMGVKSKHSGMLYTVRGLPVAAAVCGTRQGGGARRTHAPTHPATSAPPPPPKHTPTHRTAHL